MDRVTGILSPDDFYRQKHTLIFEAMASLHKDGDPIDLVTLSERLGDKLDDAGGASYLARLMNVVPTSIHVRHYAESVANKSLARRAIDAAGRIAAAAYEDADDPDELLARMQAVTNEVVNRTPVGSRVFGPHTLAREFEEYLEEMAANPGAQTGLDTGYHDLDYLLGGLRKGEVTIIAARPSVGKTALAEQIAENVASNGNLVVFASLEMTRTQLLARRAARLGKVPAKPLIRGKLPTKQDDPDWWRRLKKALKSIRESGIWLVDDPNSTTASLRADLNRARLNSGRNPDLVVIDYLQLLKDFAGREDGNSRVEYLSNQVKAISREFECPVLCLSQLSRQVEYRSSKKPKLADLRGSGAIEQDADSVVMLRVGEELDDGRKIVDGRVTKNRNGETGSFELLFLPDYVQFVSKARDHENVAPFQGRKAA